MLKLQYAFQFLLVLLCHHSYAQIAADTIQKRTGVVEIHTNPVELFVGTRAVSHQMYIMKPIFNSKKLSYFGYMRYERPYIKQQIQDIYVQSLIFYSLAGPFSLAGGGAVTAQGLVPQLALDVSHVVGSLTMSLYNVVEHDINMNAGSTAFINYNPLLSKATNWHLLALASCTVNMRFKEGIKYNYMSEEIRLGVSKNDWQFGLAADIQHMPNKSAIMNTGLFLRCLF